MLVLREIVGRAGTSIYSVSAWLCFLGALGCSLWLETSGGLFYRHIFNAICCKQTRLPAARWLYCPPHCHPGGQPGVSDRAGRGTGGYGRGLSITAPSCTLGVLSVSEFRTAGRVPIGKKYAGFGTNGAVHCIWSQQNGLTGHFRHRKFIDAL